MSVSSGKYDLHSRALEYIEGFSENIWLIHTYNEYVFNTIHLAGDAILSQIYQFCC